MSWQEILCLALVLFLCFRSLLGRELKTPGSALSLERDTLSVFGKFNSDSSRQQKTRWSSFFQSVSANKVKLSLRFMWRGVRRGEKRKKRCRSESATCGGTAVMSKDPCSHIHTQRTRPPTARSRARCPLRRTAEAVNGQACSRPDATPAPQQHVDWGLSMHLLQLGRTRANPLGSGGIRGTALSPVVHD